MQTTISEILSSKGKDVWAVSPDASVYEAIEIMADKGVGALAVKSGGSIAGILSERDYARSVTLKGKSSKEIKVREIMTTSVVCINEDRKVDECLALMTEKRIRHLPVIDGDALIGIVSLGDLVKSIIKEQSFTIDQLESYIRGG